MKENKIITITAVFNIIVAFLKLISGITFSFSTLISDSIQSFIDFFTDITSIIANKVGKRRANKIYPFGYGQVYYLANLFTGFLLFLIGIFILYQFFFFKGSFEPSISIAIVLVVALILKMMVIKLLQHYGKKFKSELMIEASKESKADFISTCVVLVVLILAFLEEHIPDFINVDKIGSFGMAIYVFYTSIKMIISNIRGLLTNDVENNEIKEEIEAELKKIENIQFKKVKVIKMSAYYSVFLQVSVDEKITIKQYLALEKKVKSQLKDSNKLIRFIDIELMN
ncbi:MAG: cation diffusion facilitator family transporter [Clostridia bacterium]|nr:cation diffusion facilitator family transporter [Clostridia bacterium]